MHRCLEIPEIFCLILDCLVHDNQTRRARFHMLAVLKTCRAFREPAAKRLWRCLYNVVPLITTMPNDLWEVSNREGFRLEMNSSKLLRFKRQARSSDWTRFDMYATYVREVGLLRLGCEATWTALVVLDDNVIFELKRRTMPILPNLQFMVALTNDLALAPTLFTPRMERLKLLMRSREVTLLTRLATALPVFAPRLRSLEVHPSGPWLSEDIRPLQSVIASLLRRLDLQEFVCRWHDALTEEMMHAVVHMPSLWKLYVTMDLKIIYAALRDNPVSDSKISQFSVTASTVTTALIPKILALLNCPSVEVFIVIGDSPDKPSDLEDITSTIGAHCSPARLVELDLQYSNVTLATVSFTCLRPLLPFCSLRHVVITSHLFSLSDDNAKTLAQSWPLIELLILSMSSPTSPTIYGTLTLRGVLWFAKYCRNMEALAVDFACTANTGTQTGEESTGIPSESEAAAVANISTQCLAVGKSTISEPSPVASFLRALFPQLMLLTWAGTPGLPSKNESHWLAVQGIIRDGSSTEAA